MSKDSIKKTAKKAMDRLRRKVGNPELDDLIAEAIAAALEEYDQQKNNPSQLS